MGKRIMVAVIFVPLIILMLFFAPSWVLPVVVSGLAMIALHEVLWSTGFVKNPKISGLAIVLAGLIPFWVFVGERMLPALVTLFLYVVLLFAVAMKSHYTVTMEKMGGSFFLSIVIPYFLSTFIRIREMPDWRYYILLPFVVAWLSDAFALFAGMAFGMSPAFVFETIEKGMGSTLGFLAVVIGVGSMFGEVMKISGGVQNLADTLYRKAGERNIIWTLGFIGILVAIPIYIEVCFIMFAPIIYRFARTGKRSLLYYAVPFLADRKSVV